MQAARQWSSDAPAAARAWLATQPDNDLTATLTGAVAAGLVEKDPAAAIRMVNEMPGDQSLAVNQVLDAWIASDAAAAMDWVRRIDDPATRNAGLEKAALHMANVDAAMALETANSLPDEASRQFIYDVVKNGAQWNPAALASLQERFPSDLWTPKAVP